MSFVAFFRQFAKEIFVVSLCIVGAGVVFVVVSNQSAYTKMTRTFWSELSGQASAVSANIPLPETKVYESEIKKPMLPPVLSEVFPLDDRMYIERIGENIPITWPSGAGLEQKNYLLLEQEIQKELENGVAHYPGTARPWEEGNMVITGHSSYYPWAPWEYKDVFALLQAKIRKGDSIVVYSQWKRYKYVVENLKVVKPENVSVLEQQKDAKKLTLITCTPVGTDLKRFIVEAKMQ